jgi:ApaG protein
MERGGGGEITVAGGETTTERRGEMAVSRKRLGMAKRPKRPWPKGFVRLRACRASSRMPLHERRIADILANYWRSGLPAIFHTSFHQTGIRMSQYEFSVSAQVQYLPEESDPERHQYAFAYTLTIRNTGQVPAQLIARHWVITDSENTVQEVKGLGVVGHQPLLKPGEHFEYTSWAVIATPVGTMRGDYFCVAEDGERFDAPVPEFVLRMPRTLH